ncbi:MAG: erythromycin esterase family protein [Lachnospiraceae bacterium]|nr:erythromycin esterase family protein [Lachnospiraceae bacterium]
MKKKTKVIIPIAIAATLILGCIGGGAVLAFKKPGKIEGFDKAVTSLSEMEIPEGTRIVALGEATHGNREFQELKLEVFKELVEKTEIRAFVLEGDMGGCAIANRYIQGGEGTAREATKHLGYRLYRTDQMCELVEWMREYNETAKEGDKVRLYGMDIQRTVDAITYLEDVYADLDPEKQEDYSSRLESIIGLQDYEYDSVDLSRASALLKEIEQDLSDNSTSYEEKIGKDELWIAGYAVKSINSALEYYITDHSTHQARDTRMKTNVDLVLSREEAEYGGGIMMSCHNGHMTETQSSLVNFLGIYLNDEYGDAYFTIGTDYYNTTVNLPSETGRVNVDLCSDDPLAYQLKDMDGDMYYLDLDQVDPGSKLGKTISSPMSMGSVGEANSPLYKVLKSTREINLAPNKLYDAMILYYNVNPTEIWED